MLTIIQAAGWPIWPLIICSITSLALIIERLMSLQTAHIAPPSLTHDAIAISQHKLPNMDIVIQLEQSSSLGEVLAAGFKELHEHPHASDDQLRACLQEKGQEVAARIQRYMGALATIASAAPMIGLLGTVIGMIEIFGAQVGDGSLGAAVGGSNPGKLAHGISIALYNTAFGLVIAIPTLMFWRYFRSRIDAFLLTMELASERFLRHLLRLRG